MVWTQYSGGGSGGGSTGGDHFAPRFLVGNALSAAPAPSVPGYFRYIQDPGDGTGIALALTELGLLGFAADVCIQEGTYTRGVGLARFVVPANCRVWSPGGVNIITNAVDDCIFQIGAGVSLERLGLTQRGVLGAAGAALVECPAGGAARTRLRDLTISTPVQVRGIQLVGGSHEVDSCQVGFTGGGAAPVGINIEGTPENFATFNVINCGFSLTSTPVRFGFTGAGAQVQDSRIADNRMSLAAGVVPIAAGANSGQCLAIGNVSRGSGSTLPTDAGVGNSINPGVANIWGP